MSPLPKPLSQRPTGMPQQRRKSGIRTAAGPVQDALIERCRTLAADPLVVLPEPVGDEPRPLAALRARLARMARKGPSLLDRLDKHVVGAVRHSIPIADFEAAPRLVDAKVGGNRRFYLLRGHVKRACLLGVQNHDDPLCLLVMYGDMARKHRLHFFAGPRLWCTGKDPQPPADWVAWLASRTGIRFQPSGAGHACPHTDRDVVRLGFRGGPAFLAACGECGRKAEGLHRELRSLYVGPQQKLPFEVAIQRPDGTLLLPAREPLAFYRAGRMLEDALVKAPGAAPAK